MVWGGCAKNLTSTNKFVRCSGYSAGGECAHVTDSASGWFLQISALVFLGMPWLCV